MTEPTGLPTWQLPSMSRSLLAMLLESSVMGFTRECALSPGEECRRYSIPPQQYFSYCSGVLLIRLASGVTIGVAGDPSLESVMLWLEPDQPPVLPHSSQSSTATMGQLLYPSPHRVESADPIHGSRWLDGLVGRQAIRLLLLRRRPDCAWREGLPCEAGLVISFGDTDLLLSQSLCRDWEGFAVTSYDEIDPEIRPWLVETPLAPW